MTERRTYSISAFSLCVIVALAFLLHLFIYSSMAKVYAGLVFGMAAVFALSKKICTLRGSQSVLLLLWAGALTVVVINYLWVYKNDAVVMDIIILFSGLLLLFFFSSDSRDYYGALSIIKYIALFFAFSVFLQILLQPVYYGVVSMFPHALADAVRAKAAAGGFQGFTTNRGFTANYILVGMFAVVAGRLCGTIGKKNSIMWLMVLAAGFFLTEKRGPLLFAVAAALICYLIGSGEKKRVKVFLAAVICICIVIFALVSFQDVISDIPGMRRIVSTINGLSSDEDITSGRSKLYAWAIVQFRNNPIFGIGWGKYKTITAGVATYTKQLDVHNVYLQLLCETGIIGFLFFAGVFAVSWILTKRAYCECLDVEDADEISEWKGALFFSLIFQTYFLLYCLTGNPLYDQFYQILYAFSCSITLGYRYISAAWKEEY